MEFERVPTWTLGWRWSPQYCIIWGQKAWSSIRNARLVSCCHRPRLGCDMIYWYDICCTEYIAKKLCPDLKVIRCNFPRYIEMSKKVMSIFRRYDPNMLAASIDEGYLKYVCRVEAASFRILLSWTWLASLNIVKTTFRQQRKWYKRCAKL